MKFLELFIGAIILWSVFYQIGLLIFKKREKINYFYLIVMIVAFSLVLAIINYKSYESIELIIKILMVYALMLLFNKTLYQNKNSEVILGSLILFLDYVISEVTVAILFSCVLTFLKYDSLKMLQNGILVNLTITIIAYVIILLGNKKILRIMKENKYISKSNSILMSLVLVTAILLLVRIPINRWKFSIEFILTMLILLSFCIIGFFMLKQKAEIQQTTSKYQQLANYSNLMNNLLEDYRVISHEQKNQLLIIRSMIDDSNKELVEYVENLLGRRLSFKYEWVNQLNNMPLHGLKGLINYKLIEMESLKINMDISISKDIAKTSLSRLSTKQKDNLYSIFGIYLDNAIQAAKESKEKEISLEIYKEKKEIVMILANTYIGSIEMEKIDNYGYTTKGKNHGIGLHIVKKIMLEDETFCQNRRLFKNYYVQELRIHLDRIKK